VVPAATPNAPAGTTPPRGSLGWSSVRRRVVAAGIVAAAAAAVVSLGPLYNPVRGIAWAIRYRDAGGVVGAAADGWVPAFGVAFPFLGALVCALAARGPSQRRVPSASHGSARWDGGADLVAPALDEPGVLVGRLIEGPAWRLGRATRQRSGPSARRAGPPTTLRYVGDGHLLTVAPTRSGKGVGAVIPNLLSYAGSVVVTDPKGENYTVTRDRREAMGHDVVALDPFGITDAPERGHAHAFNPLDVLDPDGPDVVDDAMLLADMLVVPDVTGEQASFWDNEARALLAGLILFVAVDRRGEPGQRTLPHVRALLTAPAAEFKKTLLAMLERGRRPGATTADGLIARAAARHLQKADREAASVVSTAQSHTHFLDSPRMVAALTSPGGEHALRLDQLKLGGHEPPAPDGTRRRPPLSLYLVLPAERLSTYQRWLRLLIASSMLAITRTRSPLGGPIAGASRARVLFFLDEFANLGRMRPVEDGISLAAGYGASFWLFVQDLSQLKALYKERWETFEGNVAVLQAFGTNDLFTAEHLSKRLGEATVLVSSENASAGVSRQGAFGGRGSRQHGTGQSVSETRRRLLTPDEVLRIPESEELLFIRGRLPIRARKLDYLTDAEFVGLYGANPMHEPTTVVVRRW
jgi:type IV secretion system protein VirD4